MRAPGAGARPRPDTAPAVRRGAIVAHRVCQPASSSTATRPASAKTVHRATSSPRGAGTSARRAATGRSRPHRCGARDSRAATTSAAQVRDERHGGVRFRPPNPCSRKSLGRHGRRHGSVHIHRRLLLDQRGRPTHPSLVGTTFSRRHEMSKRLAVRTPDGHRKTRWSPCFGTPLAGRAHAIGMLNENRCDQSRRTAGHNAIRASAGRWRSR